MNIEQRKKDHIALSVSGEAAYKKTAGFERFDFIHNALPEINLDEVDTSAELLGYKASLPLFVSSMTGGYSEAGQVNRIIAAFCRKHRIPFGVGSQRIMLEQPETTESFSIVRKEAPDGFISANIGGGQLANGFTEKQARKLIDSIEADAAIVHLNVLQELMQGEGDRNFKGILQGIEDLVRVSGVPVIVKETGGGINGDNARKLINAGVSVVDVSGAGGTSWSKIENHRRNQPDHPFNEWGNPTVDCILEARNAGLSPDQLMASGGMRSVLDAGKALCLGAGFTAMAQPVIRQINKGGEEGLEAWYQEYKQQFATLLCLLGCRRVEDLSERHLREVRITG